MDDTKGLSYFFLGLGIGVAVGVIFAPQSGSETRGQIRDKARDGGDYLRKRSEDVKEGATELVDRGKDLVSKQKEQFSSALDAGRQAYREAISSVRPAVREAAAEVNDAIQGI